MTHTDFEDDCPEGIEADPFLPLDPSFTPAEIAGLLCGAAMLGAFFYYIVLPHLHSAAIVMLLLASSRRNTNLNLYRFTNGPSSLLHGPSLHGAL